MKKYSLLALLPLFLAGCTVGPAFRSPSVALPSGYLYDTVATSGDTTVGARWWASFHDTLLDRMVARALDSNRNILVAASRVEQARLQVQSTRAEMGPSVGMTIGGAANYNGETKIVQQYTVTPTVRWEIDLLGKLRRMAEASQAQMQATAEDYRNMQTSVAAQVATTYFTLLQYDLALRVSLESYATRRAAQNLIDSMVYYGASSGVEQQQAATLTATAAASVEQYRRAVTQTQMSLCALLGLNPQTIAVDGRALLTGRLTPHQVPGGLPTALLDRRADIRQAYYQAQAANAKVGVAIANRYPSLTLTGDGGLISSTLKGLFQGNPFGWAAGLNITQPLFNWGRNKRAVDIARQQSRQAILQYEQAVIGALGEVEAALSGIDTYSRQVVNMAQLQASTQLTQQLTAELYAGGQSTYLDVLDAERDLLTTQLNYAQVLSEQLAQYVTLYKALGGGF